MTHVEIFGVRPTPKIPAAREEKTAGAQGDNWVQVKHHSYPTPDPTHFFFSENGERDSNSLRSMAVLVGRANKPRWTRAVKLREDMGGMSWRYKVCLIYESLVVKNVDYR